MTRPLLDKYLHSLQDDVVVMASMVEKAITRSVDALRLGDLVAAEAIVADDQRVNDKRFAIEERCIAFTATQAPVAADLRVVVAILNIIVDLERMADHAQGIARIALMLGDEPPLKPLVDIPRMGRICCEMLEDSVAAFIDLDAEAARLIVDRDDDVDRLDDQVYRELLTYMLGDPQTITRATYLIWVSHNLERIADRVTNICERIIYARTGTMAEIGAGRY